METDTSKALICALVHLEHENEKKITKRDARLKYTT